jgi:hypothetical protein
MKVSEKKNNTFLYLQNCNFFAIKIIQYITLVSFTNFDKPNLVKFAYGGLVFWLEPIFTDAPTASRNDTHFKSGQKRLKNSHLTS